MGNAEAVSRARRSLEGLSVGDAFGQLFFSLDPRPASLEALPLGPWPWTDDTHMALSIVENLIQCAEIDQDVLARAFARRFVEDPFRGYARGAAHLLGRIADGENWRDVSPTLFGTGSYGNGAAMRAAPIGGYFAGDPERAALEAQKSAVVTHAHVEGRAGAMAVAAAAAIAARKPRTEGAAFLQEVLTYVPESMTGFRVQQAMSIPAERPYDAIAELGTGYRISAQDTVPFCLWVAAHHLGDFEGALLQTAEGEGDVDTTCAIVGGIVALTVEVIPESLLARREPLPPLLGA
jgi:ADP-ribosylglycohydrolase